MERALAPHVDERWAESFLVELRLLGVEGVRIGAALSEVESHCTESGQSAEQAFGPPVGYARSLELSVDGEQSPRAVFRSLVPIIVQIPGMFLLNWSFEDWLRGERLEITAGHIVVTSAAFLAIMLVVRFADSVLRMAVYHRIRIAILMFFAYSAITATCVAALMLLDEAIWRGSAGWGLAAGAATLVGGVAWAVARLRAHGSDEDPITSPFDDAGSSPGHKAAGPLTRLFGSSLFAAFPYIALIPLGTLFLLATTLVMHQMGAR